MRVYIGYDPRDHDASRVCRYSLEKYATYPLEVRFLKEWELRKAGVFWRKYVVETGPEGGWQAFDMRDKKPFSTQFSFTRFAVPILENYDSEYAMFVDADFLFRADIAEMMEQIENQARDNPDLALFCVKHKHSPDEKTKMDGVIQQVYYRKNWSSLMVFRPWLCKAMTKYQLNNADGQWLHALSFVGDAEIGEIDEAWNWLDGSSDPEIEPKAIHYTRGTPDMGVSCTYSDLWWDELRAAS